MFNSFPSENNEKLSHSMAKTECSTASAFIEKTQDLECTLSRTKFSFMGKLNLEIVFIIKITHYHVFIYLLENLGKIKKENYLY